MTRNWKRVQPSSQLEAFRLCKEHARERYNHSVERIAELMGVTADSLYKWLGNGRMPCNLVPPYEHVCGINLVTRYQAMQAGKLVIDIPTGRRAEPGEIHELQELLNAAVGSLLKFRQGKTDAAGTLAALQTAMAELALHRGQVEKHQQPELEFGGDE